MVSINNDKPLILAPVGSKASFFAALSAGADAIYCGLKKFSARMNAKNFTIEELRELVIIAKSKNVKTYVAMNTIIKSSEIQEAWEIIHNLKNYVKPDVIIVQDLALISLIRRAKFKVQIHLSTLSNVSFPMALNFIKNVFDINNVVIPRELNIDEIKLMAEQCPKDFKLKAFVHGALCYGISGRCYWSSYMGGKSSLRGTCVQPCRRRYLQSGVFERNFSCCDLSLDVLVKVLRNITNVNSWKIEGRKKGAHYIFNTVSAYKMLRDNEKDSNVKKNAIYLLNYCLGRYGTHYNFLPQRPQNPVKEGINTGSGLLIGRIKNPKKPFFISREELFNGDVIRLGYEDELSHCVININHYVPKKGKLYIRSKRYISQGAKGTPIFLKDRKGKHYEKEFFSIKNKIELTQNKKSKKIKLTHHKAKSKKNYQTINMTVERRFIKPKARHACGIWLSKTTLKDVQKIKKFDDLWIWLPPVIWPSFESDLFNLTKQAIDIGIKNFVLNMPWQMAFFQKYNYLNLWAGPFCNVANFISVENLKTIGFKGVIVSPELHFNDYIMLAHNSTIPLGIVLSGNWPLCISRFKSDQIKLNCLFNSPKGEGGWITKYESNYWIFPDWKLDISSKQDIFYKEGYRMFVTITEKIPPKLKLKKRPGLWNFKIGLR